MHMPVPVLMPMGPMPTCVPMRVGPCSCALPVLPLLPQARHARAHAIVPLPMPMRACARLPHAQLRLPERGHPQRQE